ncbi:MAG: FMN-binding protein [Oligosphaeraceae bacterium]|nr:FMN-binding protein [Oligosphaeraceae bacterium]
MPDILKFCLSLGLICAISGGSMAFVNHITSQPRAEAQMRERNELLKLVLPAGTRQCQELESVNNVQFFAARDENGKLLAYAAEGSSRQGFGGELKVLVGLSAEGKILAVLVNQHSETPGIGTLVCERKQKQSLWKVLAGKSEKNPFPANAFLDSFASQSLNENLRVDAVSGATVSSNAVLDAVNAVAGAWQEKFAAVSKTEEP